MVTIARYTIGAAALGLTLYALTRPLSPGPLELEPDARIGSLRPDDSALRRSLTPMQYRVTQRQYTEPAFDNAYHALFDDGIYVDVVSGEPLFSSEDKVQLGTGWPAFVRPLEPDNIYTRRTTMLNIERLEVRSVGADSHLGHVIADARVPTAMRFRVNSSALRFIPADSLVAAGYAQYAARFNTAASGTP